MTEEQQQGVPNNESLLVMKQNMLQTCFLLLLS